MTALKIDAECRQALGGWRQYLLGQLNESLNQLPLMEADDEFRRGFLGAILHVAMATGSDPERTLLRRAQSIGLADPAKIDCAKTLKGSLGDAWRAYTLSVVGYGPDHHQTRAAHEAYRSLEREAQVFAAFSPIEWNAVS